MLRVSYQELFDALLRVLLKLGFERERAELSARLFADASRDGVASHGLNRFPRFVRQVRSGVVDVHATPQLVAARGSLERWDGRRGPGNLNAHQSMARAIAIAREHGIGCVALGNTNHWMRGGAYGWQAAEADDIGLCWTNTLPNLPPWGGTVPIFGNNPLIIAVPRREGHIVLDMAMSQFSYGGLESYRLRGELLPVDGGFDSDGRLTRDPAAIEQSRRVLPIGYWKGSGLALMLDLLAGILSGGLLTHQIPADPEAESRLSQMFLAIDPGAVGDAGLATRISEQVIQDLWSRSRARDEDVRYPGQHVLQTRLENTGKGIPVLPTVWEQVRSM